MSSVINVRLNERMTVQFVELYRDERLLWDKEHEAYNKRTERLRAYRRIADGMGVEGLGVPEVASKIKNIRSTYLQELKKIKDSAQRHLVQSEEEDASSPYVPKLLWFPILDSMIGDAAVKRLYSSPPASDMLVSYRRTRFVFRDAFRIARSARALKPVAIGSRRTCPKRLPRDGRSTNNSLLGDHDVYNDTVASYPPTVTGCIMFEVFHK